MELYLRFLTVADIKSNICDLFIAALKDSVKYHEVKLFFIHEHFDLFTIK
jgi:hypothetical protein